MFHRKAISSRGLNAIPATYCPSDYVGEGGWKAFAPLAGAHTQIGAYAHPPLTQFPAYWPDRQLNCGVNGISRSWTVGSAPGNPRPYFQQTQFPQNPAHLLQSGARPGGVQQMVIMSDAFAPRAYAQGVAQGAVASGVMGW